MRETSKPCAHCQKSMEKPPRASEAQWARRRHCGHRCCSQASEARRAARSLGGAACTFHCPLCPETVTAKRSQGGKRPCGDPHGRAYDLLVRHLRHGHEKDDDEAYRLADTARSEG